VIQRADAHRAGSGKFEIAPDFATYVWHLKFIYDAPKSFRVRDIVMLSAQRTF
jgi:hypothetical protein